MKEPRTHIERPNLPWRSDRLTECKLDADSYSAEGTRMTVVGKTYLEAGEPVTVLAQWLGIAKIRPIFDGQSHADPVHIVGLVRKTGPRNVLIRRANGELVVRPMRGLRRVTHSGCNVRKGNKA